jgi:hypothetical protein
MGNEAIDIKEINNKWNQLIALKVNTTSREAENADYKDKIAANNEGIANNKRDIDSLTRELRPVLGLRPGPKAKAPRKPRTTKSKEPPQTSSSVELDKTWEELQSEAKATATCPICKKLLADCTCQVSEEAAAKHKKLKK